MKFGTTPTVRILFGIVTKWDLTIRCSVETGAEWILAAAVERERY